MTEDNVIPLRGATFARVRRDITDAFADVRAGRTALWSAQATILASVDALEEHQHRMREARNQTVTASGEGRVSKNPRATSARAAVAVAPRVGSQRARILIYAAEHPTGVSDYEISRDLRLLPNSTRPRRGELVEAGYLADTGTTRIHRGSPWIVWMVTDSGQEWYVNNQQEDAAA
ncbi:hypothetical protein [Amycolatopsis sp. NPDC004625]|uniref:hypothetical protein n=1 Tax=Amycolatopsis sp. NPDC004625 TaxID=3154670 RepID=UPI0033AC58D5